MDNMQLLERPSTRTGYLAYVRISTARQGMGVSLQEQRAAIVGYAAMRAMSVIGWYEEHRTAASTKRPVFKELLDELRAGRVRGVIIHKIDRGARNLRDWAELAELADLGLEIHFAGDGLDMTSRGGRLAADIQAVVAADYIRNLREEAKKGIYGRLKQGYYPFGAPIGYRDQGAGRAKVPDPAQAPLVKESFAIYAGGGTTIRALAEELTQQGLASSRGQRLSAGSLGALLRNPFYMGTMLVKGQRFLGRHVPLVSKELFERVQAVLLQHRKGWKSRHRFLFQRLLKCAACGYSIIGEERKEHIYYRCHSLSCKGTCLREEALEEAALAAFESEDTVSYKESAVDGKRALITARFPHRQVRGRTVEFLYSSGVALS